MGKPTLLHKLLLHALLAVLLVVFIVPFIWILQTSLKTDRDIGAVPPKMFPVTMSVEDYEAARAAGELSPFVEKYGYPVTLRHYRRAFAEFPFLKYLRNTMTIVLFSVIGTLISCTLAAYAFGCLRWPDRNLVFALVIGTMLLPYQVTLIPMFMLFRELGWINTLLPLIVPAFFGSPFFIFLLRQFFITLPRDLFEAARLDGAGEWTILLRIVVPLSKPALLTVAIFSAMFAWNDFLGPLIYLSSEETKTLAVGLQSMVTQVGTEWGLLMAAGTMMILPILLLFFLAQRYFIEGIALSGMKA